MFSKLTIMALLVAFTTAVPVVRDILLNEVAEEPVPVIQHVLKEVAIEAVPVDQEAQRECKDCRPCGAATPGRCPRLENGHPLDRSAMVRFG